MAWSLGHRLPRPIAAPLFGDRARHGLSIVEDDPCWVEWTRIAPEFYEATQRQSAGDYVNHRGYRVMRRVDLEGARVLEIGPGHIDHLRYWNGTPELFTMVDVRPEMLETSGRILTEAGVHHESLLVERTEDARLPLDDASCDVAIIFYTLEHLHPLDRHLTELVRVLRPGGRLVSAIPCEGGLGVGMARYVTSRRWFKKHTTIDPDKLICWEHPNFAETVIDVLDARFERERLSAWPFPGLGLDLNLVAGMIHRKPGADA